jgi:2-C-methyl-D-erythritol 4-phosphate cytidylyltransferase
MSGVSAIIVAAGAGARFGEPKQFVYLRAKPVLEWTLERFQAHPGIGAVVLVLPDENDLKHYRLRYPKIVDIVRGGERRQDSVWQGFRILAAAGPEIVLVHDGARPLVPAELITRVIEAARADGAAVPVLAVEDTVKEVRDGKVGATVDRTHLFRAQTPQGFRYDVLKKALDAARHDRIFGTDEAALVERIGLPVTAVAGDPRNIKITTPVDIPLAEALLDA